MNLHFQYFNLIWLLGGVLLVVLLYFFLLRWKKKVVKRIGDKKLVQALTSSFSPLKHGLKFGVLSLAFAAGVLAVMNLRKPGDGDGVMRKGIDVVIAMDVSKSMLATDLAPNRLERARQLVNKLMAVLPDDRIGLVVFAGQAYLQMPLTTDHGAAAFFVAAASPDAVPTQGTVISEALRRSAGAFNAAERRYKAVVLISDGEDHDPEAVTTAKELAAQGMMINTVGVGSPEGAFIPDPATGSNKKDQTGADVVSRLNETELQEVAKETNGVYVRLEDSDDAVKQLQQQLSQIESKSYGDVSLVNFKSYYWWFTAGMLALLLLEFFIPETRKVKA